MQKEILLEDRKGQKSNIGDAVLRHTRNKSQGPVGCHGNLGNIFIGLDVKERGCLEHPGANDAQGKNLHGRHARFFHGDDMSLLEPWQGHVTAPFAYNPHEKQASGEVAGIANKNSDEKPGPGNSLVEDANDAHCHIGGDERHATEQDNNKRKHENQSHHEIGDPWSNVACHPGADRQGKCRSENDESAAGKRGQ